MTMLVTGASGFIGRVLLDTLRKRGDSPVCLTRPASNTDWLESQGFPFVTADLADSAELASVLKRVRPARIFHLAGQTKATRSAELFQANQLVTANLAAAAAGLESPPTLVSVSSLAAAGPSVTARIESERERPVSAYGRSKLAAEQALVGWSDQLPISIVRPPAVFGPEDRDSFEMYKSIVQLRIHPVPTWSAFRISWIHVQDVCEALLAVAERGHRVQPEQPRNGVYFAAAADSIDYAELGQMIAAQLGCSMVCVPVATPVLYAMAAINHAIGAVRGKPHILNLDKAREATAGSWCCSAQKLTDHTGYQARWSLSDTIRNSAEWYVQAGWLRTSKSRSRRSQLASD